MEPTSTFYRLATPELPLNVTYRTVNWQPSSRPGFTYIANYFSVLLVYRGTVQTSISGKPRILQSGDIRIFLKDDLHLFQSLGQDTRYVQISMSPGLFAFPKDQYFYRQFVQPLKDGQLDCPRLLQPGDPGYEEIYQQMHRLDQSKEGQAHYNAELFSIAVSLCTSLIPYCRTGPVPTDPTEDAIRICLKYMSNHDKEKITLEQLAELVHLHPNYLCTVFKKYTGKTIFDHLTRQRLRRASRRLRSTRRPVQQIAENCGFPSVSFFNRKFHELYGYTPTKYRKKFSNVYTENDEEE